MKKAAFVLPAVAWMIIILIGAFLLMSFLFKFRITSEFYYAGCDGDIVGQSCFLGEDIEQCGKVVGTVIRYIEDEEEKEIAIGESTFLGLAHPRCTRHTDESSCLTAYPIPFKKGGQFISFCNWNEIAPDADGDEKGFPKVQQILSRNVIMTAVAYPICTGVPNIRESELRTSSFI